MEVRHTAAGATIFLVVIGTTAWLYGHGHRSFAELTADASENAIKAKAFEPGVIVPLAKIHTPSGVVTVSTIAGNLTESSIEPSTKWEHAMFKDGYCRGLHVEESLRS